MCFPDWWRSWAGVPTEPGVQAVIVTESGPRRQKTRPIYRLKLGNVIYIRAL